MESTISQIELKPNDYKVCSLCGAVNFYENDECVSCDHEKFSDCGGEEVDKFVEQEYEFYEGEGYSLSEISNIKIHVK